MNLLSSSLISAVTELTLCCFADDVLRELLGGNSGVECDGLAWCFTPLLLTCPEEDTRWQQVPSKGWYSFFRMNEVIFQKNAILLIRILWVDYSFNQGHTQTKGHVFTQVSRRVQVPNHCANTAVESESYVKCGLIYFPPLFGVHFQFVKLQNAKVYYKNISPIKGYNITAELCFNSYYYYYFSSVSPLYSFSCSISRYLPQAGFAPAVIPLYLLSYSFRLPWSATLMDLIPKPGTVINYIPLDEHVIWVRYL
jgi:hypothetical protein